MLLLNDQNPDTILHICFKVLYKKIQIIRIYDYEYIKSLWEWQFKLFFYSVVIISIFLFLNNEHKL